MYDIFVGSSAENLDVSYAIQTNLENYDFCSTVWTQGVFKVSQTTIESLDQALLDYNYAILVFTPDDVTRIREETVSTVRDNVIFELGLFIGALGRKSCFIVIPNEMEDLHLPTDLQGITLVTYQANRNDSNWVAALGAACNKIVAAIKEQENNEISDPKINWKKISGFDGLVKHSTMKGFFDELIKNGKDELWLCHTFPYNLFEIRDTIEEALRANRKIKLLLASPELLELRLKEIDHPDYEPDEAKIQIVKERYRALNEIKARNKDKELFDFRVYNERIGSSIYIYFNQGNTSHSYIAHYLSKPIYNKHYCKYIHFEGQNENQLDIIKEYFDQKWNKSSNWVI